jgi:predicted nuclease of predicted toxin-antitoxin system
MFRFLADANFNYGIVKGCRRHDPASDFLSANEARLQGVPDPEVLAFAAEQNRILVTRDLQTMPRHFGEFPMRRQSSPGVFLVSLHPAIGEVIDELVLISRDEAPATLHSDLRQNGAKRRSATLAHKRGSPRGNWRKAYEQELA